MGQLAGRVAVVTGGANGIGRAATERFLAEGAAGVVVTDIDETLLKWTDGMTNVKALAGSIADEAVNVTMVETALREWGRLDIAFLNAGVMGFGPLLEATAGEFASHIAVNLIGTVHGLRASARAMRDGGDGGSIVITSSVAGVLADVGNYAYNGSKAALLNIMRSAAGELAPHRIRVNAICPGPTRTGMGEVLIGDRPELDALVVKEIPMKRWADPRETANAVLFLASDEASYITGVTLPVDGGCLALNRMFGAA